MAAEKKSKRSGSSRGGEEFLCENLNFAGKEAYKRLRTNLRSVLLTVKAAALSASQVLTRQKARASQPLIWPIRWPR